jgi:hypothetical protein
MSNINYTKSFRLQPSEELSKEMRDKLQQINENYKTSADFSKYMQDLGNLFGVSTVQVTEDQKRFLGGFIEGEASMNVSAKKLKTAQFGLLLDPEFSITQHVNGFSTLYLALSIFRTGRIRHKHNSNATLVFVIDNRKSLEQKVLPFYEKYVKPYGSSAKAERLENFIKILALFNEGGHKDLKKFRDKMLPIWDAMRMQKGQSNETFASLEAAQQYVTDFSIEKS